MGSVSNVVGVDIAESQSNGPSRFDGVRVVNMPGEEQADG